jgi:hypothetical protein
MSERLSNARKTLFIVAIAGLLFVTLEFLLQIFYFATVGDFIFRRALPPIYEADPTRCYRVKANLEYVHHTNEFEIELYTNSIGLRTDSDHLEIPEKKADGIYRILITGPSFAFGWGANYDEIYTTLIENGLVLPGKRIQIMNLGTPSQGSAHQLCWLKKIGYRYTPDMVFHTSYGRVVTARAANCPAKLECPDVQNGHLVPHDLSSRHRFKAFLKRFGTVFYGYYAYNMIVRPDPAPDASKALHMSPQAYSGVGLEEIVQSYLDYEDYVKSVLGPETAVAFMYLPYSYQVHTEDIDRFADVHAEDIPDGRRQISETISRLKERGVSILNTLPPLLDLADRERFYYWLDIHLTPAGNRVVAEAAIPFIRDLILKTESPAPTLNESGKKFRVEPEDAVLRADHKEALSER